LRGLGEVQRRQIEGAEAKIWLALLMNGPLRFSELQKATGLPKATLHDRLHKPKTGMIAKGLVKVLSGIRMKEWRDSEGFIHREPVFTDEKGMIVYNKELERFVHILPEEEWRSVEDRLKNLRRPELYSWLASKYLELFSNPEGIKLCLTEKKLPADFKNTNVISKQVVKPFILQLTKREWGLEGSRKYYYLNFEFKSIERGADGKPVFEEESP